MKLTRTMFFISLLFIFSTAVYGAPEPNDDFNSLLGRYVVNGRPVYKDLKAQGIAKLGSYLDGLGNFDMANLKSDDERKAFWINAYNAFALKIVLDNYPNNRDLFKVYGFFDIIKTRIAGKNLSLIGILSNEMILGKEFKDPRINFAISNGMVSSPALRPRGFNPATIEKDLDDCAGEFIRNKDNVSVVIETLDKALLDKSVIDYVAKSKIAGISILSEMRNRHGKKQVVEKPRYKLMVSAIFKWFERDFTANSGTVSGFISKYLDKEDAEFILEHKDRLVLDYNPYNYDFAGF